MIVDNNPFNLIQHELISYILDLANNPRASFVCKQFQTLNDSIMTPPLLNKLRRFEERIPLPFRQEGESDHDYLLRSVKTIAALQNEYRGKDKADSQKPTNLDAVIKTLIKRERKIEYELAHHFYRNVFHDIYDHSLGFSRPNPRIANNYYAETKNQRGNIKAINFTNHKIKRLPLEIAGLRNVTALYLSGNQLTFLPPWFERLQTLEKINLAQNQFSEFPEVLLRCQNLKIINLSENQLTTIPRDITNLPHLSHLLITKNKFPKKLKSWSKAAKELKQTLKILKNQGCVIRK